MWRLPGIPLRAESSAKCFEAVVSVGPDRERADRYDMAIGVTLDAIGERGIDRRLFGGRLQPQPRPAGRAHRDRIPSTGRLGELASDAVTGISSYRGIAASPKETGHLQRGGDRNHEILVERDDHAGNAGDRTAGFERPTYRFLDGIEGDEKEIGIGRTDRDRLHIPARYIEIFEARPAEIAWGATRAGAGRRGFE